MSTKLNIYAPLNDLGYGIFARGIIKGLFESGYEDLFLSTIGQTQVDDPVEISKLNMLATKQWNRSAPSIAIWHEFDLTKFSGKVLLPMPIFETTKLHPAALYQLSQMDAVLVQSKWAKEIVENNVPGVPVFVVQGASDDFTSPLIEETSRNSAFTFVNVGKYEKRKSPLELVQAYVKTFAHLSADTRLVLHCINPFDQNFTQNMKRALSQLGLQITPTTNQRSFIATAGNAIIEIPTTRLSKEDIFRLYKYSHVGVFPSKAEGWNLPLMECIKTGTPCIATNYSAHTEYLTKEYDYNEDLLLNKLTPEVAMDNVFFHGDRGTWMGVDINEISEKMLYAFNNYSEVTTKFNNTKIKEHFTWKNSANQLIEVLKQY